MCRNINFACSAPLPFAEARLPDRARWTAFLPCAPFKERQQSLRRQVPAQYIADELANFLFLFLPLSRVHLLSRAHNENENLPPVPVTLYVADLPQDRAVFPGKHRRRFGGRPFGWHVALHVRGALLLLVRSPDGLHHGLPSAVL